MWFESYSLVRLFVAIEVNDAVRGLAQEAVAALVRASIPARFEAPEKLHVTVAFLGDVRPDQLEDVKTNFRESAQGTPFLLQFDMLGAYPNVQRPNVIWLGTSERSHAFALCANKVRTALSSLGFSFDHEATPHVTICRPKGARGIRLPQLTQRASLDVGGLTLFQSLPAGQTTRYEAIDRTTLGGRS